MALREVCRCDYDLALSKLSDEEYEWQLFFAEGVGLFCIDVVHRADKVRVAQKDYYTGKPRYFLEESWS